MNYFYKYCVCFATLMLSACATHYEYTNIKHNPGVRISEVVLILDYLSLKDDIGKHLDFDENLNTEKLEFFENQIRQMLQQKGYRLSETFMLSSGLLLPRQFPVEHHKDGQQQDALLNPPFLYLAENIAEDQPAQHADLLAFLLNQYVRFPISNSSKNLFNGINLSYSLQPIDLADDTAILYVQINEPKISAGKVFGVALLGAAVSAAASDGNFVAVGTYQSSSFSNALFLHKGSGQLLWKNHLKHVDKSSSSENRLFQNFPERDQIQHN